DVPQIAGVVLAPLLVAEAHVAHAPGKLRNALGGVVRVGDPVVGFVVEKALHFLGRHDLLADQIDVRAVEVLLHGGTLQSPTTGFRLWIGVGKGVYISIGSTSS